MQQKFSPPLQSLCWIVLCAVIGGSLLFLFEDSCQQDAPLHFLFARWAWKHPALFVDVWCRPLFTGLYALPALFGYQATRVFTLAISLAISWQTWRLAEELRIERAPLAAALVWMQPSFFLFSTENMTEPIFALVLVIALRLHHAGWIKAGMVVASLMILARPEGFFLGTLWALFVFPSFYRAGPRALPQITLLSTGAVLWWAAAWGITGDPLFIKHNWPANWPLTGTVYGAAGWFAYPLRLPEITGLLLLPVFITGLAFLLRKRKWPMLSAIFLLVFFLHTVFRAYGMLGSAGYPRYCVTVSPVIAIITLAGWNRLARFFSSISRPVRIALAFLLIGMSFYMNFVYVDGSWMSRDAPAIRQVHRWFLNHPERVEKFIWSQPYACIAFDRDPWEQPLFTRRREADLQLLRASPAGTLVYWDEKVGPAWFGLEARDFEAAGFRRLHSQSMILRGYILDRSWFGFGGPRNQTMSLFYRFQEEEDSSTKQHEDAQR